MDLDEDVEEDEVTWANSQALPTDLSIMDPLDEPIFDQSIAPDQGISLSATGNNFSVSLRREPPMKRHKAADPSTITPITEVSIDAALSNFLSMHQEHTESRRKQQLELESESQRAAQSSKPRRESHKSRSTDPTLSVLNTDKSAVNVTGALSSSSSSSSVSQSGKIFDRSSVVKPLGFPLSQTNLVSTATSSSNLRAEIPAFILPSSSQISEERNNSSEDFLSDEAAHKILDEIEEKLLFKSQATQPAQGSSSVATVEIDNKLTDQNMEGDELDAALLKAERDFQARQLQKQHENEIEDLSAALNSSQIGEKLVIKLSPETIQRRLGAYGDPDITFPLDAPAQRTGPIFLRGIVAEVKKVGDGAVDVVDEMKVWYMCRSGAAKETETVKEEVLIHPETLRLYKKIRILLRGSAWPTCDIQPGDVVNIICLYNGRDATNAISIDQKSLLLPTHPDDRISKLLAIAAIYPPNYITRSGAIVVDDIRNALVVHPDVLIAPTKINYATACKRKALMGDAQVDMGSHGPASGGALIPLMGNMKHQLFQFGLRNGLSAVQGDSFKKVVHDITSNQKTMLGLYAANQSNIADVQKELHGVGRGVEDWLVKFGPDAPIAEWNLDAAPVRSFLKNACFICGEPGHYSGNCPGKIKDIIDKPTPFRIKKIIGIEDQMWSPMWGIKGVIDATGIVEVIESSTQFGSKSRGLSSRRLPLEIKTGNRPDVPYSEHKAQILLYDLLMQERDADGIKTTAVSTLVSPPASRTLVSKLELPQKSSIQTIGGILIYLSNREEIDLASENLVQGTPSRSLHGYGTAAPKVPFFHATHVINAEWNEQRHLIVSRNEIASLTVALKRSNTSNDVSRISVMPAVSDVPDGERTCSKCYQFAACAAHYVAKEIPTMHVSSDIEESVPFEDRHRDSLNRLDSAGMGALFRSAIQHVEPRLAQYVSKWLRLTELEGLAQESREIDGKKRSAPLFTTSAASDLANENESKEDIDTQIFAASYTRSVFWRESSAFREKRGQGIGGLVLVRVEKWKGEEVLMTTTTTTATSGIADEGGMSEVENFGDIFEYTLETAVKRPLDDVDLNMGEWVVLSGEGIGPFGLLSGSVTHLDITEGRICIRGDRNALETIPEKISTSRDSPSFLWRLDRDDIFTSSNVMRENLIMLLLGPTSRWLGENFSEAMLFNNSQAKTEFGDVKRQRLLVNMDAPKFDDFVEFPWTVRILTEDEEFDQIRLLDSGYRRFLRWRPNSEDSLRLKEEYHSELNPEQKLAIEMALRSQDYSLILGMPGTGKTATTAFIVRCLVALGQSVLITSHTHTAVDNLLLKVLQKISKDKVNICRIGRVASVKSSLREFCLEEKLTNMEISDLHGLHSELTHAQVVGTTSLAIKHVVFSQRKFDVCIVDEAGQILEPVALGPLRTSNRFVMIGDHHQLPPLVKSESAKKGGMDVSLFKRLAEKHPSSVTPLTMQYRMNADIMALSNMLVYGGRLRCGSIEVQSGKFVPPLLSTWREKNNVVWLSRLLEPSTTVLFVNTDSAGTDLEKRGTVVTVETEADATLDLPQVNIRGKQTRYAKTGTRAGGGTGNVYNEFEADRVLDIVDALLLAGASPSDMCVISPYNAQVRLIRGRLSIGARNEVDVDTVDRFQGQDKNIVIFSFVRSNSSKDVGALLADIKRLNVAITRPKQKFVLVGSASTLSGGNALLNRFIEEGIRKKGWLQEIS